MARRASFQYSKPNGSKSIISILQAKWLEEHPFDTPSQMARRASFQYFRTNWIFLNKSNAIMQRGGELPLPSSQGSCASYLKQASGLGSRVSKRAGVGGLRRAGWTSGPWERAGRRGGPAGRMGERGARGQAARGSEPGPWASRRGGAVADK